MLKRARLVFAVLLALAGSGIGPGLPVSAWAARQAAPKAARPARRDLLDINTATAAQLKALPGMGNEYARRIIAGRPYTAKNQLVNRGVLPQPAYDKIAPLIIARRPR